MSDLKTWLAQTESWRSSIDYNIPLEDRARYSFLDKYESFYIAVVGYIFEQIDENDRLEWMAQLARGLEIFAGGTDKVDFPGIDMARSRLYTSIAFYLSKYESISWIIGKSLKKSTTANNIIDGFLIDFVSRSLGSNKISAIIKRFLAEGNESYVTELISKLEKSQEKLLQGQSKNYITSKLALKCVQKFKKNNIWEDLKVFYSNGNQNTKDKWKVYINEILLKRTPPIWELFQSQREVLQKWNQEEMTYTLQMPTSAGKTALCEIFAYNEFINGNKKTLFLAPFRALALEISDGFAKRLERVGVKSITLYGNESFDIQDLNKLDDINLIIATPEKFRTIVNRFPEILKQIGMVICDEGHLLDGSRGPSYELFLSKIKIVNPEVKTLFISAIIPNIADINTWLGGNSSTHIKSSYKPTSIDYAVLRKQNFINLEFNPTEQLPIKYILYKVITDKDLTYINNITGRPNKYKLSSDIAKSICIGLKSLAYGSVMIYTPTKGKNGLVGLANEMLKQTTFLDQLPKPIKFADRNRINDIFEYFSYIYGNEYIGTKLIEIGVAWHCGDLPQYTRELLEEFLRKKFIKIILCTNTLAEGVNLPVRTLVIHSTKRWDEKASGYKQIALRDLKNIVGRVGRAGSEMKGTAIFVNEKDITTIRKLRSDTSEEVKGYIYMLISFLNKYLNAHNISLTNDIFEHADSKVKNIIDDIDTALLELLAEDVGTEGINSIATDLATKTFAYYSSSEDEKTLLKQLFSNRAEYLSGYLVNNTYKELKYTNTSPRIYSLLKDKIDLSKEYWKDSDPLNEAWVDFVIETAFSIEEVNETLNSFNKKTTVQVDMDKIKLIIKLWMIGATYKDISNETNLSVIDLLLFFNKFINSVFTLNINILLRLAEYRAVEANNEDIYTERLSWTKYLSNGFYTKTHIEIQALGVRARETVIEIYNWLVENKVSYLSGSSLKDYLHSNKDELHDYLIRNLPKILTDKFDELVI